MKRKLLLCLLALAVLGGILSGCSGSVSGQSLETSGHNAEENPPDVLEETDSEENYTTGNASLDNPRNQDGTGDRELLTASFGTSFNDSRRLTIGAIENALETAFPDWSVRRGFTSQIVIDHVKNRDGISIDNVEQALARAVSNGVRILVVQPTHLMNGFEYQELADEIAACANRFEHVALGEPLLNSENDFSRVADALIHATAAYDDGETAICFMGHGTEADSNGVYAKMQQVLTDKGMVNYYIGTVEALPSVEDVLTAVQSGTYTKVVLQPFMIVAGDHANNDMAGDDEDSWKTIFEHAGYEVTCILRGLGELEDIQQLFVEHAQAAMDSIPEAESSPENTSAAESTILVPDSLTPVYAADLKDGTYPVKVDSSSSMFHITDCVLTVSGDHLTAVLTMGGTGYLYVYPGTAEEAAAAPESDYIPFTENADGIHTFEIPVAALNENVFCAAFSKNREQWYDRTLLFHADSLPADAFMNSSPVTAQTLELSDGIYTAELSDGTYTAQVTLNGGSGRASVMSPAALNVHNGICTAVIEWSSPDYDYMKVNGELYLPVSTEGNSIFEIPVAAFDRPLTVYADTTAMSQPHEIEYVLTFDSATLKAT